MAKLIRDFYKKNSVQLSQDLLGKILVRVIDGKRISCKQKNGHRLCRRSSRFSLEILYQREIIYLNLEGVHFLYSLNFFIK